MAPLGCFRLSIILLFAATTAFARDLHDAATAVEATPLITAALFRQSPSAPNESRLDHVARSVKMSKVRLRAIASRALSAAAANASIGKDLVTPVSALPGVFEYGMILNIGTPAVTFQAVADTGSDIIWIPCNPYTGPTRVGPVFDPTSSTTYKSISCQDQKCTKLQSSQNCGSSCGFSEQYEDGATVSGSFATETVTLSGLDGTAQAINDISFGCLHTGSQGTAAFQGVVGFGRGPTSLVSQLGSSIHTMFSYCLPGRDAPPNTTSKLVFGASAALQGGGIQVTSIIPNPLSATNYWVDLQAIGVDETRIAIPPVFFLGGTILDSGTAVMFVQPAVYSLVLANFKNRINLPEVDYSSSGLPYCVDASSQPDYVFPFLTLYFENAAIGLPQHNYFVNVDTANPDTYCLMVLASTGQVQVIGNTMQQNFQLSYDLGRSKISWKPAQCDLL